MAARLPASSPCLPGVLAKFAAGQEGPAHVQDHNAHVASLHPISDGHLSRFLSVSYPIFLD